MLIQHKEDELSERQYAILRLLMEKSYLQGELQTLLDLTAPNLHYHLKRLEKENLILKKTVQQIGNAKINEISIQPAALQRIRNLLGLKVMDFTLITGFGEWETGYRVPDMVFNALKDLKYPISKVICFTTPEAKEKREKYQNKEKLRKIDRILAYPYVQYRHYNSEFFQNVESFISEELQTSDVIIDITPLSKLYSFKFLEIANKYALPCIYLGQDETGAFVLFQMSGMKINGQITKYY